MKYLSIALVALFLSGCAFLDKAVQYTCSTETRLHNDYVIAVSTGVLVRPAAKVALESANYAKISAACITGDPFQVLGSLVAAAKSLRK